MSKRVRERLTYANVMATIAVFVAIGGGAYAAGLAKNSIKSKHIKDGAVKAAELGPDSVTSAKVAAGALLASDFANGELPAGPRGPEGPQGERGPAGVTGPTGATGATGAPGDDGDDGLDGDDGSPDTGSQILGKLATVDGPGSGLNADQVDGLDPMALGAVMSSRVSVAQGSVPTTYAPIVGISESVTSRAAVETGSPARPLDLRDLAVQLTAPAGGSVTYSVSTPGGAVAIQCSIAAGATGCTNATGSGTVPAGSPLALTVVEGTGANAAEVTATVGFRLTPPA